MRSLENSKVGIAEKTDYLLIHTDKCSPCQQTRMPSSTKSDDGDQFDGDFVGDVEKRSSSPELYNIPYKEEFLHISDKTIDFHAKNLLSDSGTECSLLGAPEEELTSLDDDSGIRSEGTDAESEGQDERDSEDSEKETNDDDAAASQEGKDDAEDFGEDSYEMTYIELSQTIKDVSDDDEESCMEQMKNLKISVHSKLDSEDDRCDEKNVEDSKHDERAAENQGLNVQDEVKNSGVVSLIPSSEAEDISSSCRTVERPEFYAAFLPVTESRLCSLSERAYAEIAEHLLDEQTLLKLSDEEEDLFNSDPCRTTLNADDIPFVTSEMELSNPDPESTLSPDEPDRTCKMTYVELDVTEPSSEDLTFEMFSSLSINDDKILFCRGNPSDQDGIQNHSICSEIDQNDFEVPTVDLIDKPPFMIDGASADTALIDSSPLQEFYSLQRYLNSDIEVNVPDFPSLKTYPEVNSVEERPFEINFPKNSFMSFGAANTSSSFQNGNSHPGMNVSFLDDSFKNDETDYENEYVTKNLQELKEITDILGLPVPESQNTIPSFSTPTPPPSVNNIVPFPKQMCATNHVTMKSSLPTTPPSVNSNVIPRVTTQTPGTQSDAIPAHPRFFFFLSTSLVHGIKRPSCIEMSEPAKKPFGYDSLNNSAFSEGDHRKKAKQMVEKLTEERLLKLENNESCLHEAVRKTDHEYVIALLKRLATMDSQSLDIINSKNEKSQTPLHLAVQKNKPAIVHLLIKYGAEVNHLAMTSCQKLESPLHYVASRGNQFKLVFKCLLKAKDLDINIKNSEGQTALHCAVLAHGTAGSNPAHSINNEYNIKKLLTSGADPLLQDSSGKNILMHVIESKEINLVSHIIKTVSREHLQELLEATTPNEQTCLGLAHSLKEQYNEMQWEKLINMLTLH